MMEIPFDLGGMIRDFRAKNGLSRQQFADRVNMSSSLIRDLEQGKHENITMTTLTLIAKELGLFDLNLRLFEPTSEEEVHKFKSIQSINTRLYLEHPTIVQVVENTIDLEIEKIKRSIKTLENPKKSS